MITQINFDIEMICKQTMKIAIEEIIWHWMAEIYAIFFTNFTSKTTNKSANFKGMNY